MNLKIKDIENINGKADIKNTPQIFGSLRYQTLSVAEGASIFSDLHCTSTDQSLLDKIGKLKKFRKSAKFEKIGKISKKLKHSQNPHKIRKTQLTVAKSVTNHRISQNLQNFTKSIRKMQNP